ncbi:phosphodiester glycosidase family protein [Clostridium folliculivorans]|uniref:Exopolysaccharide biosynthesis protein n=1 Tax=Clostridium folliculivorans TaxID=2886038 RepID=A0A9W5Y679_9CLOT|nr:phosphodiester glycosidase family protein [Clostridium folliculivorans]GKU27340.1 exopolysaccharide biosynthesis protein [Clostridium folliculivorans]GKU32191.1 exopolysaccharide biosynthesis protein [Clostridium folliculivorans]
MRKTRTERNKDRKKKRILKVAKHVLVLFSANIVIGLALSIPLVYYGPFINIKEFIVTTAMTTLRHQYIATLFLSNEEINKIMDKQKIEDDVNSDISQIAVQTIAPPVDEVNKEKQNNDDPYNGIKLIDISNDRYKGYVLIIDDPKRITVASSTKLGSSGMKLDEIMKEEKALVGINAGGFEDENGKGNGGKPLGVVVHEGKVVYGKEGVEYSVIGFNNDGVLVLGRYTLNQIRQNNIKEAVSFSPFLIVNGEPTIKSGNGGWGIAPRTAIGQRKDGSVVMLVIDGRQVSSVGATLRDVQDILLQYDVYNAANLDGGASTTMYYKDKIINKPSSLAGPRTLPTAFIVK